MKLKAKLNNDIGNFKNRFRTGTVMTNPNLYRLNSQFGHTNIDKLSLLELYQLGFNSIYITKRDLEKE